MVEQKATNVVWHKGVVDRTARAERNRHKGVVIWLTGLSGSGKSTVAVEVEKRLFNMGVQAYILDGDNIRQGLNKDLGFSPAERTENIRRIGEVAKLFADSGAIVITAFISPYCKDRDQVRFILEEGEFIEIFVDADLETCKERDPKGLYKKAISGEIPQFTGISAPYEAPKTPEVVVDTAKQEVDEIADEVVDYLIETHVIVKNSES